MKRLFTRLLLLGSLTLAAHAALPGVQLKDLNGKTVNTAKLNNDGKPLVISFWATWCKPCMRELKALHEVYDEWQEELGVRIVIVSIDAAQDAQKVKPLVDGFGWDFEVLLDPNGDFKRAMNVQSIPHLFVLDGKGNIVHNNIGYTDGEEGELYEVLKGLK